MRRGIVDSFKTPSDKTVLYSKKRETFNIPHLNMNITSLIQGKNMYITSLIQGKKTRGKMDPGTKKENY